MLKTICGSLLVEDRRCIGIARLSKNCAGRWNFVCYFFVDGRGFGRLRFLRLPVGIDSSWRMRSMRVHPASPWAGRCGRRSVRFVRRSAARLYLKSSGQDSLRAVGGIALFEAMLAQSNSPGIDHVIVLKGKRAWRAAIADAGRSGEIDRWSEKTVGQRPELNASNIEERVERELRVLAAEQLKLRHEASRHPANLASTDLTRSVLAAYAKHIARRTVSRYCLACSQYRAFAIGSTPG